MTPHEGEEQEHRNDMRLADLHRHLDGSMRAETLRELAGQAGVGLPQDIRFYNGMGLHDALARFAITVACLQKPGSVARVASEICEDAAAEGVETLEIRFAPQLHHGSALEDFVDAAVEGAAGRAGIILCALFGDAPEIVERLVSSAKGRPGVVGLDLAGGPNSGHHWSMPDYEAAFVRARHLGLGRTVHAGEGRPPGEIRTAIEVLGAQRIGHGTTLLDDESVLELVLERGVVIEACPTSNVQTNVIGSIAEHPLSQWLDRGVKVCVNTDNTLLSDTSSTLEHQHIMAIDGMTQAKLAAIIEHGHNGAFKRS